MVSIRMTSTVIRFRKILLVWLAVLAGLLLSPSTMAINEDLSFGSSGKSVTTVGSSPNIDAFIVQADSKLVVAGTSDSKTFVARYGADGGFDTTFSGDGIVWLDTPDVYYCNSDCLSVSQQQDGKLVLATANIVVRLDVDGSLDSTFNGAGILLLDSLPALANRWVAALQVVQQLDGKLVVGGAVCSAPDADYCRQGEYLLLRLDSDGTLDSSFGVGGIAANTIPLSSSYYLDGYDRLRSLLLLEDGRFLMMDGRSRMISFTSAGQLDTTFNQTGQRLAFEGLGTIASGEADGLLQQSDGKIVLVGRVCRTYTNYKCVDNNVVLMRFSKSGMPDTTFGNQGSMMSFIASTGSVGPTTVLGLAGGKLLAGYSWYGCCDMGYGIRQFNTDGTKDTSVFSGQGATGLGSSESFPNEVGQNLPRVAFQSSGKLVRAGAAQTTAYKNKVVLFRYSPYADTDADGVANSLDWWPADPAQWQEPSDHDADGIANTVDNCTYVANIDQLDNDNDYDGDICDSDDDNDDIVDGEDVFPFDGSEWLDNDSDGTGNNADNDDDNDGLTDEQEIAGGSNPFNPDSDSDSIKDSMDADPMDMFSTQYTPLHILNNNTLPSVGSATALAAAGDVDGDGYPDVIIGYPDDIYLRKVSGSTPVSVTTGSARIWSGKTGQQLRVFYGNGAGERFGHVVSGAGDVDNDGYDDVIVGAPEGTINGYHNGYARIYSGATGKVLATLPGIAGEDGYGYSVSAAGDVDQDGYDDVVVGMKTTNANRPGYAQVISGKKKTPLYTFWGDSAGDQFGSRVRGLGDLDQDGYPDIGVLVVHAYANDEDAVRIYSGHDGSLMHVIAVAPEDSWTYGYGAPVVLWPIQDFAPAGDADADGYPDILITRRKVKVVSGKDYSVINPDKTVLNEGANGNVSTVGDLNKDGHDDWAVSGYDFTLLEGGIVGGERTRVRVYSGADNSLLMTLVCDTCASLSFGSVVAGIGDVDGDGYPDIAVGKNPVRIYSGIGHLQQISDNDGDAIVDSLDPDDDNDGYPDKKEFKLGTNPLVYTDPYILAQRDAASLPPDEDRDHDGVANGVDNCPFHANPSQLDGNLNGFGDLCDPNLIGYTGDLLGTSIAAGHVDSPLRSDFLVGIPGVDLYQEGTNYLMKDAGLLAQVSPGIPAFARLQGDAPAMRMGSVSAFIEARDGSDIILVQGFPDADVTASDDDRQVVLKKAGKVELWSRHGVRLSTLNGKQAGAGFGASLAVGDVNADGHADLLVGSPRATVAGVGAMAGTVTVLGGTDSSSQPLGEPLYVRSGTQAGGQFGSAIAIEKYTHEILVGSAGYDVSALVSGKPVFLKDAGRVERFVADEGLTPAVLTVAGERAGDRFGAAISAFNQDISGDGANDWVVGAPDNDFTFLLGNAKKVYKSSGKIYLYSGDSDQPFWTQVSTVAGDKFGTALCASGDYDADGLPDLAIGMPGMDAFTAYSPWGKRIPLRDAGSLIVYSGKLLRL